VVLCPATGLGEAHTLAERIRAAIQAQPSRPPVTLSLGVTALRPDEDLDQALDRADRALLKAKEQGRNQVQVEK